MKLLCYDHGLCLEGAITLARAGHSVSYFTPWQSDFPEHGTIIGKGFEHEGVTRVDNFSQALALCDALVCFDTYSRDREEQAVRAGKPVWGAKGAERLELDRVYMKRTQEQLKLPTQPWTTITGVDKLADYLKTHKDKWVKATGLYRGLIETFHHDDWTSSRSMKFSQMQVDFGPLGNEIEFLIEDPVGDVEPGWDGFFCGGKFSENAMMGYEDKDESYIGHITRKVPEAFQLILDKTAPLFKAAKANCLVSFEARVTKDKKAYLIDPCCRAPHPPFAVELEIYSNFADVITWGANEGRACPKNKAPYGAAIELKSTWVDTHFCEVILEKPQYRQLVKLQKACCIDGRYWALPHSFVVATCVGLGTTAKAAVEMAKRVADTVKFEGRYYDEASLDQLLNKTIPEGVKYGIDF